MSNCGQACPYNTLNGCKVKEYNGTCPLTNMALADFEAVKDAKPKTNADRIRAMSDEELAGMLRSTGCPLARSDMACKEFGSCRNCWLEYLKQPVKDGEDDG